MPRRQASKVRTHPSMALFTAFFPCSTKFVYCKQQLNAAETWQWGYESVSFVAWYSFLHCQAGLEKAQSDDAIHPGSLLHIRSGPLHRDSWTIQAPSPCNHPPSIFGTWAASTNGSDNTVIAFLHWSFIKMLYQNKFHCYLAKMASGYMRFCTSREDYQFINCE